MIKIYRIFLTLILTTLLFAQTSDGNELLEKLQDKYDSINDFTASFEMHPGAGRVSKGTFYYKSKDKFRVELRERTLVGDGESIWNYIKKNKKVIITSADDEANSFSINDYVYKFPEKCNVLASKNNDGKNVLILKPKSEDLNFSKIELTINGDYLIDTISMEDLMGNKYRVELSNTKINQNLSDKLFTFETPQGTQIIDLR